MYELRFPYRPLHWVTDLETDYEFEIDGLQYILRAEKPYLVLKVKPFPSEQDALDYMPRVWDALARVAVELRTGFIAEMQVDKVTYADNPQRAAENRSKTFNFPNIGPVDGIVNGHMPSVFPTDKNIRTFKMGEATATVTWSAERYTPVLVNALSRSTTSTLHHDDKMRTVIGLFSDIQREIFPRSRFLTCIIALEVLANPLKKHYVAQRIIDEMDAKVNAQLGTYDKNSDEWHSLESLRRELTYRRDASLRSSIRQLILDGLEDLPEDERTNRSKEVVWAYDMRSKLVHDGTILDKDLTRAHEIAYNTLIDLLKRRIANA